jgi:transcriptional regulator of acetoin/glycerol metabolism
LSIAAAAEAGRCRLSAAAMDKLLAHAWPGNVRELWQVLRRAVAFGSAVIQPGDLVLDDPAPAGARDCSPGRLADSERELFRRALRMSRGNRRAAAAWLGIPKSTFCDRLTRYGLHVGGDEPPA